MIPLKAKLNGTFLERITKRADVWSSEEAVSAAIHVPEDMKWWYYNEFGTANLGVKGGKTYAIPSQGFTPMTFPGAGGELITVLKVNHPGIRKSNMVGDVKDECLTQAKQDIKEHFEPDTTPAQLKEILLDETMPKVKETVRKSFEAKLTGSRPDGKLTGKTAAEVFEEEATIVDTSNQ